MREQRLSMFKHTVSTILSDVVNESSINVGAMRDSSPKLQIADGRRLRFTGRPSRLLTRLNVLSQCAEILGTQTLVGIIALIGLILDDAVHLYVENHIPPPQLDHAID